MLDFDLAALYEVETKVLNQAVKRNSDIFPDDFMFRLTIEEWKGMRSQSVTASEQHKRNTETTPYAFTEHGVTMLANVLRSKKARQTSIAIVRAFVFMRQYALTHKDLTEKLNRMEHQYNKQFRDIHQAIDYLLDKDKEKTDQKNRKRIGFNSDENK